MSYATLQRGISYFIRDYGYIAFVKTSIGNLVLGDPISCTKNTNTLIINYLKHYPNSHFFYISSHTKLFLDSLQFNTHKLGDEHSIHLPTFQGTWSTHKSLRSGYNKFSKSAIFFESTLEKETIKQIHSLEKQWILSKDHKSNISFMIRPFTDYSEQDCRYFFSYTHNELAAVLRLTPTYNQSNDYYCDAFFSNPELKSIKDYMMLSTINLLRTEGAKNLNLGLSPFSKIPINKHTTLTETLFRLIYLTNFPKFGYRGINVYQNKFHGVKESKFMSTRHAFTVPLLWKTWCLMSTYNLYVNATDGPAFIPFFLQ